MRGLVRIDVRWRCKQWQVVANRNAGNAPPNKKNNGKEKLDLTNCGFVLLLLLPAAAQSDGVLICFCLIFWLIKNWMIHSCRCIWNKRMRLPSKTLKFFPKLFIAHRVGIPEEIFAQFLCRRFYAAAHKRMHWAGAGKTCLLPPISTAAKFHAFSTHFTR